MRQSPQHPCAWRCYNNWLNSLLGVSGAGLRSRWRRFAPDARFSRRFPGRDRGLGWHTVMVKIDTSNVQLFMVLDCFQYPSSGCVDVACAQSIDLHLSGVWSRPAGQRAQRGQHREGAPKSPPIEARTDIPSALTTTTTTAPSQPPAERRGMHSKPSMAPASSAQGLSSARGWGGGRRTSQMPQMTGTKHVRPRSHPHGPSPAHPSGG